MRIEDIRRMVQDIIEKGFAKFLHICEENKYDQRNDQRNDQRK